MMTMDFPLDLILLMEQYAWRWLFHFYSIISYRSLFGGCYLLHTRGLVIWDITATLGFLASLVIGPYSQLFVHDNYSRYCDCWVELRAK